MVKVIKKADVRFRIQVYDLKAHKSRTISLEEGNSKLTLEELKKRIEDCFPEK